MARANWRGEVAARGPTRAPILLILLGLFACLGSMWRAQPVLAQAPTPLVFCPVEGQPMGDALVQTLRIQARGSEVLQGAPLSGALLPEQVASARERCALWSAGVIVWLANAGGSTTLNALDCRTGRALSEITEPPAGQDPAEQRAVALKLTSLVHAVRTQGPPLQESDLPLEPAPTPPADGVALHLGATAQVSRVPSIQGAAVGRLGLLVGLGVRAELGAEVVSANVVTRLLPGEQKLLAEQQLETSGVAPGLSVTGLLMHGRLSPSIELAFFLNHTVAEGTTALGRRGETSAWIPQLELTAGVGYEVTPGFSLEARAGGICGLLRRRFEVDGVQLADTGTCGVVLSLGLRH